MLATFASVRVAAQIGAPPPKSFFDLPSDVQGAIRDHMRPHAKDQAVLRRYANLVTSDAFVGADRATQLAAVEALSKRPTDAKLGKDLQAMLADPRVESGAKTKLAAAYGGAGVTATTRDDLRRTAGGPAFKALSPDRQSDVLAGIVADPKASDPLLFLTSDPSFGALPEATQSKAIKATAVPQRSDATRDAIDRLVHTPEFGKLDEKSQGRWLDALGHADPVVADRAGKLANEWLDKPGYQKRTDDEKALILSKIARGADAPDVVTVPVGHYEQFARPSTLTGGATRTSTAFETVKSAEAKTYTVTIDKQKIEVVIPTKPDAAGGVYPNIDEIRASLERMPPSSRKELKRVVVEPRAEEDTGARARAKGVVSLYPDTKARTSEELTSTLVHETGHELGERVWGPLSSTPQQPSAASQGWKAWEKAEESDGKWPSAYAAHSPHEDLAETMVLYQRVRGTSEEAAARAKMPARFAIIDDLLTR